MGTIQRKIIDLAGLTIAIDCTDSAPWGPVARRYGNFLVDGVGDPDETILIDIKPNSPRAPGTEPPLHITQTDRRLDLAHGTSVAFWDKAARKSVITQHRDNFAEDVVNPEACLDSLIRIILSFRLLQRDALLIHSAGLLRGGRGFLFPGYSGAGKSTIAAASMSHSTVLSDDMVLLRLTKDGAFIHGTPFFGSHDTPGPNLEAPLAGVYFITQADQNRVSPLSAAAALPRLMASYMFFGEDRGTSQQMLDLAVRICETVPMYHLDFTRDATFWNLIDV